MNDDKYILIQAPYHFYTIAPTIALPSLSGQLKAAGFNSEILDLNIKYFNEILSYENLSLSIKKVDAIYKNIENHISKISSKDALFLQKYNQLKVYISTPEQLNNIPRLAEAAIKILKNPQYFYNFDLLKKALNIINIALLIISLPYPQFLLGSYSFNFEKVNTTYKNIDKIVLNKNENIFYDFCRKKADEIIKKKPKFVGISITYLEQIFASLALAYFLKNETNAHINIGGNFVCGNIDYLIKNTEIFDKYVDSVSYGEGEIQIVKLAKYLNNEIPIEDVPGIVYKKGNEIKTNPIVHVKNISDIYPPDYSSIKLDEYLSPHPTLPISFSRGCYWHKCAFCVLSRNLTHSVKNIKKITDEIEFYIKKYNVKYFDVIDESVSPKLLEKIADYVIENKLDVKFDITARFEKEFTKKLLKKLYKAGFKFIYWGLESANQRVLDKINKGIDIKNVKKILKNAHNIGIYSTLYCFTDFPTETYSEAMDTLNFVFNDADIIEMIGLGEFALYKNSLVYNNPDKYNIKILKQKDMFSNGILKYIDNSKTEAQKQKIHQTFEKRYSNSHYNKIINSGNFYLYRFYYNDKYGIQYFHLPD